MYIDGRWLAVATGIVIVWMIGTIYLVGEWNRLSLMVADLKFLLEREQEKKMRVDEVNAVHEETLAVIKHDLARDGNERPQSPRHAG